LAGAAALAAGKAVLVKQGSLAKQHSLLGSVDAQGTPTQRSLGKQGSLVGKQGPGGKPEILNPKLSTLNPKPYTLHSKP